MNTVMFKVKWSSSSSKLIRRFKFQILRACSSFDAGKLNSIMEYSGCSDAEAKNYITKNNYIRKVEINEFEFKLRRLKGLNVSDKNSLTALDLLKYHPVTLKHRFLSLEECGIPQCNISSNLLIKYLTYIRKTISFLKYKKIIHEGTCVQKQLSVAACVDYSLLKEFDESSVLLDIKMEAVRQFLIHVCEMAPDDPRIERSLINRLKYKSLREVKKSLDLLLTRFGFTKDKIARNSYVIFGSDAENSQEIIDKCPVVAGLDISQVILTHPKILSTRADNFIKIVDIFKKYDIADSSVAKCLEVFTLSAETVTERLEAMKVNNLLNVRRHHPRVLELIIYHSKARARLKELERMRIPYASLNRLASSDSHFQKFCDFGSERHHGQDIIYFLKSELGVSRKELLSKLNRHPYWTYTSLVVINSNLTLLRQKGFTNEDIIDEISILLYPTKRIEDEMEKLAEKPEVNYCCDEDKNIRKDCILSLVLYFIEKEINFSGGAIWDKEATYPQPPHFSDRLPSHDVFF